MNSAEKKSINFFPFITRAFLLTILTVALVLIVVDILNPNVILLDIIFFLLVFTAVFSYLYIKSISTKDRLTMIGNADYISTKTIFLMLTRRLPKYTAGFINICDISYINGFIGSVGGDLVLREYSQILRSNLKPGEYIGRMGGDNFVVLLKRENTDNFLNLLDRVEVKIKLSGETHLFPIRSRIGLYDPVQGDSVTGILENCCTAMNHIKAARNSYVCWYDSEMSRITTQEKDISFHFPDALSSHEFHAYYQPKVDSVTGKLCGAEALARWIRNGEVVVPYNFIPILEKSGQITDLDFYIFEEVCSDIQRWTQEGRRLVPISSNFSKYHLKDADFAAKILSILSKYNIDRSLIELELTESVGMEDFNNLKAFLQLMSENHIRVAIDDFGVGYSSLELLKDDNFQIVKIDKSFIDNIADDGGNNNSYRLMTYIATTCKNMDKQIVCEGVENTAQKDLLKELGCTKIQGYFYDKPLPVKTFEERLENYRYSIDEDNEK